MRKCYIVIGSITNEEGYLTWISCVKSSWKKATECCKNLKAEYPDNDYSIQVEWID